MDLGIVLPSNWNARPIADDSQRIAREIFVALAKLRASSRKPVGLRVPSVLGASDHNVLLDPSRKLEYSATVTHRIALSTLRHTGR
jgi:hypothetical protein